MSYTTKLTVEIDIETQFGPADAISMIDNALNLPAITGVNVIGLETNYKPFFNEEKNCEAINNIPLKLR